MLALNAFQLTGTAFGTQLAVAVCIIDPESLFILEGLAGARELIIETTKRNMEKIYSHFLKIKLIFYPLDYIMQMLQFQVLVC